MNYIKHVYIIYIEIYMHTRTSEHINVYRPAYNQTYMLKIKLELSHYTPQRRLGERRYSSYSFSALNGSEWSASRPGRALALGKGPPVLIYRRHILNQIVPSASTHAICSDPF
jgi:hypothetical protein